MVDTESKVVVEALQLADCESAPLSESVQAAQTLPAHDWPALQECPQVPQFAGSTLVTTQLLPQT
jgi:hypothetical protein